MEMRGSGERKLGAAEDTRRALPQTGERKHSHVMMEFAPSPPLPSPRWADNRARRLPHLHAHTLEERSQVAADAGPTPGLLFFFTPKAASTRGERHELKSFCHEPVTRFQWE